MLNEVFIKQTKFSSDYGFIFNLIEEINYYSTDHIVHYSINYKKSNNWPIIGFDLFLSRKVKTYSRKYLKVQYLFAEIGGIIAFLMNFGKIIVSIFGYRLLELDIVNTFGDLGNENYKKKQGNDVSDMDKNEKCKHVNNDISNNYDRSIMNYYRQNKDDIGNNNNRGNNNQNKANSTFNELSKNNRIYFNNKHDKNRITRKLSKHPGKKDITDNSLKRQEKIVNNSQSISGYSLHMLQDSTRESIKINELVKAYDRKFRLGYTRFTFFDNLRRIFCPTCKFGKDFEEKKKFFIASYTEIKKKLDFVNLVKNYRQVYLLSKLF